MSPPWVVLTTTPAKPAPNAAGKAVASKPAADAAKSGKWVFTFGDGKAEGKAQMRDLLDSKHRHRALKRLGWWTHECTGMDVPLGDNAVKRSRYRQVAS